MDAREYVKFKNEVVGYALVAWITVTPTLPDGYLTKYTGDVCRAEVLTRFAKMVLANMDHPQTELHKPE